MDNKVIYDDRADGLRSFYNKIYGLMGMGVLMSAVVSYIMIAFFANNLVSIVSSLGYGMILLFLVPLLLVVPVQRAALKNSPFALPLFIGFSAFWGFELSFILLTYTASNVTFAFLTAAGMFFGLSIYGRLTKRNLSGVGKVASAAVIGLIIAMVLNMFIPNSGFTLIISLIGVLVFSGLIAWDNQKIESLYNSQNGNVQEGWAVSMALMLYLDFINLFLFLLRIFGIGGSSRS